MSRIADAVRSLFAPAPVRARRRAERSLAAALPGIATQDMLKMTASANEVIRAHLTKMRQQSRALALNNDYVKRFLSMCEHHIVGPVGVRLQVRARDAGGTLDRMANDIIETAYEAWSKPANLDVVGRKSMRSMQKSVVRTMARDGEAFVRMVKGFKNSAHRFALQQIPAELVDETYWDERKNIVCGVERDEWDRPTAYYLRQERHSDVTIVGANGRAYLRVPASEMLHVFLDEFPGQVRGIPWMHTSMVRLHQLGAYEEAEVMAARIGASKQGFVVSPDGGGDALADGLDDQGRLTSTVTPGAIDVLPAGYDFKSFDPTHPSGNFGPFIKATLRGIASGLGVSYNDLASDLEGVNYSSIRVGLLSEREQWKALQRELAEQFLDKMYPAWLEMAFLVGALAPLPASKFEKFNAASWHFRGWAWVDPQKDIDAAITAVNAGLKTRTQVLAEQGLDLEETLAQLAEEQKLIEQYGVRIESKTAPTPAPPQMPNPAE